MAKRKWYVVWEGHQSGIYDTWAECQKQIKNFPLAKYKSFSSEEEAIQAYTGNPQDFIGKKSEGAKSAMDYSKNPQIILPSISVDAACSGNPGIMEYRGVLTQSKKEIFRQGPFEGGTNNIGEFLALVHGLAFLKKHNQPNMPIYTDSRTAQAWVRNKKTKTTLLKTKKNEKLFELMDRGIIWLKNNSFKNPIIKWETKKWGEIPADFGRK